MTYGYPDPPGTYDYYEHKITIRRVQDGMNVWVGEGTISESGRIEGCTADIGEEVYDAIEKQIADGEIAGSVQYEGVTYVWLG